MFKLAHTAVEITTKTGMSVLGQDFKVYTQSASPFHCELAVLDGGLIVALFKLCGCPVCDETDVLVKQLEGPVIVCDRRVKLLLLVRCIARLLLLHTRVSIVRPMLCQCHTINSVSQCKVPAKSTP